MLRIQDENVIGIFKFKIVNETSEKIVHPIHINLPKNLFIISAYKHKKKLFTRAYVHVKVEFATQKKI